MGPEEGELRGEVSHCLRYLKDEDMLSPAFADNVKDYVIFSWLESRGADFSL